MLLDLVHSHRQQDLSSFLGSNLKRQNTSLHEYLLHPACVQKQQQVVKIWMVYLTNCIHKAWKCVKVYKSGFT